VGLVFLSLQIRHDAFLSSFQHVFSLSIATSYERVIHRKRNENWSKPICAFSSQRPICSSAAHIGIYQSYNYVKKKGGLAKEIE